MSGNEIRVAVLAPIENCSPKVLALGLENMLGRMGVDCKVFYGGDQMVGRLFCLRHWSKHPIARKVFRMRIKAKHWLSDRRLLRELRSYDAIIFANCIPNAFWRD